MEIIIGLLEICEKIIGIAFCAIVTIFIGVIAIVIMKELENRNKR